VNYGGKISAAARALAIRSGKIQGDFDLNKPNST